jgi:hypothetical protein
LVDYHNELLSMVDVAIEDGRPEAWELTDKVAERPEALDRLTVWLEEQFGQNERIVVKDPRLAWFFELHRAAADRLGAEVHVATMLRHPAEVMRSREIAYGTKTSNTTRVVGWMTMMLGTELRSRDLPRATVRYDDLLTDWRAAMTQADETIRMGLFDRATPEQVADAGDLVDPTLRRSVAEWEELELPPRLLDLATRTYDTYGRLVGVPADAQAETRAEFDVARTRTGANVRREKRKVARRVREEMRAAPEPEGRLAAVRRSVTEKLRRSS